MAPISVLDIHNILSDFVIRDVGSRLYSDTSYAWSCRYFSIPVIAHDKVIYNHDDMTVKVPMVKLT